jgi:hypothetical protein
MALIRIRVDLDDSSKREVHSLLTKNESRVTINARNPQNMLSPSLKSGESGRGF